MKQTKQDIQNLIEIKTRHLQIVRMKIARKGYIHTAPETLIEKEDLEKEIVYLKNKLKTKASHFFGVAIVVILSLELVGAFLFDLNNLGVFIGIPVSFIIWHFYE